MPDTPFRTPDEWRRAREAARFSACNCPDRPNCFHVVNVRDNFDRLYPCPPEPVDSIDTSEPPEPDRAEESSDRDRDWILAIAYAAGIDSGLNVPIVPKVEVVRQFLDAYAARAAVLARMQPQGVECVVATTGRDEQDGEILTFRVTAIAGSKLPQVTPGQRVRVSKVEGEA